MHATSGIDGKARAGDAFPALDLAAASGQLVKVPDPPGTTSTFSSGVSPAARSATFTYARSSPATTRSARPGSGRSPSSTPPPPNWPSTRPSCRSR